MPEFRLSATALDPAALRRPWDDTRAGACVLFEGRVRGASDGTAVTVLEYEAHEALAVAEGGRVLAEALERFGLLDAECVHRTGSLLPGDLAVWVAVNAAHRGAAFEGCRYVIDEIKARVPLWKKEHYAGAPAVWVEGTIPREPGAPPPGP